MSIKTSIFFSKILRSSFYKKFFLVISFIISINSLAMQSPNVYVSPDGNVIAYSISDNNKYTSEIFFSFDEGKSFQHTDILQNISVNAITGFANNTKILYASGFENSAKIDLTNPQQIKLDYLADKYENFSYADLHVASNLTDKTILLGGHDSDNNASWLFIGNNEKKGKNLIWHDDAIAECGSGGSGTYLIKDISGNANSLYLASETFDDGSTGLCQSQDSGASWHMLQNFPEPHSSAVFYVKNTGTIYSAGYQYDAQDNPLSNLYISNDSGTNWNNNSFAKVTSQAYITAISGNESGNIVYVATDSNGLWVTQDEGKSWGKIEFSDHKNYAIKHLACSKDAKIIAVTGYVNNDNTHKKPHEKVKNSEEKVVLLSNDYGITWKSISVK